MERRVRVTIWPTNSSNDQIVGASRWSGELGLLFGYYLVDRRVRDTIWPTNSRNDQIVDLLPRICDKGGGSGGSEERSASIKYKV